MIHGRHLIVSVGGIAVGASKSCTIDAQAEMIETASASQGNYREFRAGRSEWSVNITHLVTPANSANVLHTGMQVALSWIPLLPGKTLPFNGFIQGINIETFSPVLTPAAIWWSNDLNVFVAEKRIPASTINVNVEPTGGTFYRYGVPTTDNWCSRFVALDSVATVETSDAARKFNLRDHVAEGIYISSGSGQRWNIAVPDGYTILRYRIVAVLRAGQPEGTVFLTPQNGEDYAIISASETTIQVEVNAQSTYFVTEDISTEPLDRQVWLKSFEIEVAAPPRSQYFRSWLSPQSAGYMSPSIETNFDDGSNLYYWDGTNLAYLSRVGGSALVQHVRLSGTVGMLAQGQVQFQGCGEISEVNP